MMRIIPLPQMLQTTMTASATIARVQFVAQPLTATPASFLTATATGARPRPIAMMIGPVTIGGKQRMTRLMPNALIAPARMR